MDNEYEVVIIGAGSMGMAAGYNLAKLGKKTLLIDSFDPPHSHGSHHGDTRIIRHAYGEGRQYVPLALRAQELWEELEKESGKKLFDQTGVLCAGIEGTDFIEEAISSAKDFDLPVEVLSNEEINRRWPGIILPKEYIGCLETNSGVLFCEECIRAYRELGLKLGMTLLSNTVVEEVDIHSNGATIKAAGKEIQAETVIISAGAWVGKILKKSGIELPLQPTRQTTSWFECDEKLYNSNDFPAFTIESPNGHYYGFPSFDGSGLKVGRYDGGEKINPSGLIQDYGFYSRDEGDVRGFLEKYIPKADGKLIDGKTCIFTFTPDEDFIIDQLADFPHAIVAAGFSGHGFKFASVVGEILSDLASKGSTRHDISMFSLKRKSFQ